MKLFKRIINYLLIGVLSFFGIAINNHPAISAENLNFTVDINCQEEITLCADPNSNVTVGSEVSLRGGGYQGTTIVQGYTRCIYFVNSSQLSRLNFNWYSTDERKAIVSVYGTVTAVSPGIVNIVAVSKTNPKVVGIITFTIEVDSSNKSQLMKLTTDKRDTPNATGTQVINYQESLPGGFDINVGYTRFICLESNFPSTNIQDYIWTSSNPAIATISAFGTITARQSGTVEITCAYKYNSNFSGTVTITVNN